MTKQKTKKPSKPQKKAKNAGRQMSTMPKKLGKSIPIPRNVGGNAAAMYKRLLFDPCGADLVEPPYIGMESGYLTRTRDVIVPFFNITTAPLGQTFDFFVQWSPGNISSTGASNYALLCGGGAVGAAFGSVAGQSGSNSIFQSNFINAAGTPVNSYRVVACCIQWVPSGPLLDREGVVSLLSLPSFFTDSPATPVTTNQVEAACPHVRTSGTEKHEVVWVPGSKDQEFGVFDPFLLDPGFGTLAIALGGADSVVTPPAPPATVFTVAPRGRVEITTVWQWTARAGGGLVQTVQAPPKHTLNDVLSTVKDLGHKLYTGGAMVSSAYKAVSGLI